MITKISQEQPFQVLTNSFSISPSSSGYDLEISADGKNYTKLFTVAANTTRLVTGVAANSYYRLKGNTDDEVVVNWMKQCVTEGGGGGGGDMSNYYTKAETNQEISNATQDMATETWVGQQGFLTEQSLSDDFYTKEQTDAAITAATAPIEEETEVISNAVNDLNERVTGLTETVETSNEVISTAINDINDRIEAVEKYVDEAGEVAATSLNDLNSRVKDVEDYVEEAGEVVATSLNDLETNKQDTLVSGTNIKTINNQSLLGSGNITIQGGGGGSSVVSLTQAQYDALVASGTVESGVTYVITDATAVDLDDYALQSDLTTLSGTVTANTASLANKADKANVTARAASEYYLPGWNSQGVITGGTAYYNKYLSINGTSYNVFSSSNASQAFIYAPTSAGTAGQPLLSNGSGAPVWGTYKFAFITQTAYDALTTKDSTTIYFIIGD